MTPPRILIAGIGNIFMGDDGFGSEVARRLAGQAQAEQAQAGRALPAGVRVIDFGIRGFDLAYALLDGYDVTILVDAVPRGGAPGTLYTIEPDLRALDELETQEALLDTHAMHPLRVLALARSLGAEFKRLLLVGCEPLTLGPDEGLLGLSEPVTAALDEAVSLLETLVAQISEEARQPVQV
jgi:hydrogenase maturation protease